MGDDEKAKNMWGQALELEPGNTELKKFMFVHGLY